MRFTQKLPAALGDQFAQLSGASDGNIEGTGAGHPHDWTSRFVWDLVRKRMFDFWEKGKASQSDYKDIVRFCGEESRRVKDQLEFRRKNLHPLLDVEWNIITKDEGKAEVINAFLVSVFISHNNCF